MQTNRRERNGQLKIKQPDVRITLFLRSIMTLVVALDCNLGMLAAVLSVKALAFIAGTVRS